MNKNFDEITNFRQSLAEHFHGLTGITRSDIFGDADASLRPINLMADSAVMFSGYVGSKYKVDEGILLLGINPGGGGDSYTQRSPEDEQFYPLLHDYRSKTEDNIFDAFEAVNKEFVPIVMAWNLWRIIGPTLEAAGVTIEDVAYMNIVPYRTRGDKMPPSLVRRTSWKQIIAPTLELISPRAVIALGKKAGSVVDAQLGEQPHVYCIPRTIGDSYISDEARSVLSKIQKNFSQG